MSDRHPRSARARTMLAAASIALLALTAATVATAAKVAPPATARDLAQAYFSNTLTRAEVLTAVGRGLNDYRIDEGRVTAVRPNAIDLLERDGTRQTIAIGQQTLIVGVGGGSRFGGAPFGLRGTRVVTLTDNGAPAMLVRPSATARALGKVLLGTALVRAEVVTWSGKLQDVKIDEGRIVAVKPGSMTLLERDGTRQPIAVAATTLVTQGAQTLDPSAIVKGLSAITIRVNDGPAQQVVLVPGALGLGR